MNKITWPVVVLIAIIALFLEFRYVMVIDTPVVAKFDRLTGKVWIVNSGVWRQVVTEDQAKAEKEKAQQEAAEKTAKAK